MTCDDVLTMIGRDKGVHHCRSCHDGVAEGYDMLERYIGGEYAEVCCSVAAALDRR